MVMWKGYDINVCKSCPLFEEDKRRVPWEVNGKTAFEYLTQEEIPHQVHIVFVGEAPGHHEEIHEKPFIHKAG
ncbi:MAG: hypothetical protein ACK4SU_01010, partial [Dictyoglomus sp.]